MTLKQFLKPDWRKILIFDILFILAGFTVPFIYFYSGSLAYTFLIFGFPFLIGGEIYSKVILLLIYWYILSCFIAWIIDRNKKPKETHGMKKIYKVLLIIVLFVLSFFSFISFLGPSVGDCWRLEKDYKITVSSAKEAADLINDYYFAQRGEYWENITEENINATENVFRYGFIKVDSSGKLFECFLPI